MFILGKVKNTQISDDILQDVFLKILTTIDRLEDSTKLTSWVYQITRNTIADHFRKTHFELNISDFDVAEHEDEEPLYLSLSNCINHKINKLPEKYKLAILLTSFEGYSQITLAENLGITYSGGKSRVQRAKEKLKTLVSGCDNVETDIKGKIIDIKFD